MKVAENAQTTHGTAVARPLQKPQTHRHSSMTMILGSMKNYVYTNSTADPFVEAIHARKGVTML